jgi:DNA polymerase III subunit delta
MPVHLLYGTDEYAITNRVNEFHKAMGDPTTADMNTTRLDGHALADDALNNAVNAMPFLAAQRLVILTNPSARYVQAAGQKKFLAFLEQVPASAILILIEPGALKETHWLVKWTRNSNGDIHLQSFNMPRRREMPGWIIEETKKQGGKIELQAATRLAEMVGEDTRQASQEISKLLTYINYKHAIDISDVEAVSIVTAQADVFIMVDALGEGNGKKALSSLHQLLEGEDPFQLFGMIVRQFRMLLQAREVMDAGGHAQAVSETLHLAPFVGDKIFAQARGFKMATLENIHRRLLNMDEAVKTGEIPLETALEMFAVEMTRKS